MKYEWKMILEDGTHIKGEWRSINTVHSPFMCINHIKAYYSEQAKNAVEVHVTLLERNFS